MIGTTLSHFRIVAKIGEGGMGVVYRAEDTKLRRDVALKVLPPDLVANEERRLRFLREARTAAAINHPNIATIHEVDEADGVVFIAMELVEGKTLRDHIGSKPMAIKDSLRIATEMAEGLAKAHGAHVIHRDFKPDNVIVTADGHVKILDFGLAKLLEDPHEEAPAEMSKLATLSREMTREGKIFGTPAYMSPEQARGQQVDARSDLFSFGTTLYEMVTSKVPFEGKTATDTLSAIIRDEPPPPSQLNDTVPLELDRIIAECLEKDPQERYLHTDQLVADLKKLKRITDSGVQAVRTPSGPVSVPQGVRKRTRRLAVLGVVAIALIAVGVAILWNLKPQPRFQSGDRIIVADFENTTGRPEFDTAIRDSFEFMLDDSAFVKVIRGEDLAELLRLRASNSTSLDSSVAKMICGSADCEGFLTGKIESADDELQLEVSLWIPGRDEPTLTRSALASSEADILLTIHQLVLDLRRDLGEARNSITNQPPPTTTSLLAYQILTKARDLRFESPDDAVATLTRAIELDPNFLDAYTFRGKAHNNAGSMLDSRHDHLKAYELSRDLSDHIRLRTKISYLWSFYDFDGVIQEARAYQQLFPHDPVAHNALASSYVGGYGDYALAEKHYRLSVQIPQSIDLGNLCWVLLAQGKADDIHRVIIDYQNQKIHGIEEDVFSCTVSEDAARGDLGKVLNAIDHLEETRGTLPSGLILGRLGVLLVQGRLAEAASVAPALWQRALIERSTTVTLRSGISQAWLELRRGTTVPTIPEEVLQAARQNLYEFNLLVSFSVDVGQASPLSEVIREHALIEEGSKSSYVRDTLGFARGALALINGKANEAIDLLAPLARNSHFTYRHHVLGRAYERVNRLQEAAVEYEWVAERPLESQYIVLPEIILDQFRLARVYEKLGNTDRARHWYKRFTEDWKDADADIPELIEARERLAELKGDETSAAKATPAESNAR